MAANYSQKRSILLNKTNIREVLISLEYRAGKDNTPCLRYRTFVFRRSCHAYYDPRKSRCIGHDGPGPASEDEAGVADDHQPAPRHITFLPGTVVQRTASRRAGGEHAWARGGYTLARKPEQIAVAEIILAVENMEVDDYQPSRRPRWLSSRP